MPLAALMAGGALLVAGDRLPAVLGHRLDGASAPWAAAALLLAGLLLRALVLTTRSALLSRRQIATDPVTVPVATADVEEPDPTETGVRLYRSIADRARREDRRPRSRATAAVGRPRLRPTHDDVPPGRVPGWGVFVLPLA